DPKMISSIFYLRNQNDDLRRQLARADEECRRWRELSSSLKPTIRCMAMSHGLDCDEWPALADGLAAKVRAGEAKLAAAQAEIKRLRASLLGTEGRKG
ncbi:MAG: hypothetical protein IMZ50_07995, partial [Candidatus Atribacteria bacterium]|nr:hypothetical protein [Candidatus Atribacteria bacterium]